MLTLLLDADNTFGIDTFVALDKEVKGQYRSGWKELTKEISFSNMTKPPKKSSRKREQLATYAEEETEIAD